MLLIAGQMKSHLLFICLATRLGLERNCRGPGLRVYSRGALLSEARCAGSGAARLLPDKMACADIRLS